PATLLTTILTTFGRVASRYGVKWPGASGFTALPFSRCVRWTCSCKGRMWPRTVVPASTRCPTRTAGSMCQYWNDMLVPAGDGHAPARLARDLSRGARVDGSSVGRVDVDALVEGENPVAEKRLGRTRLGEPGARV